MCRFVRDGSFVVKQQRLEALARVPLDVVGEHTKQNMRTDAVGRVTIDEAGFQIHVFETAKDPFDDAEPFVGAERLATNEE